MLIIAVAPYAAALDLDFTYKVVDSESYYEKDEGFPYPRMYVTNYIVVTGVKDDVTSLSINGGYSETKTPMNPRWETTYYFIISTMWWVLKTMLSMATPR